MTTSTSSKRVEARRAARQEAERAARRRSRLLYGGVGLAVLILAVVIAALSVGEQQDQVTVEDLAGDPAISGDPLPTAPQDPTTDPAVGQTVPSVEGTDFAGSPISIGDAQGPELVMFLASWCPACQQELPQVVDWMAEGGVPDDVDLTAVVTGLDATRPNWPPDAWLEEEGFTGDVLVDDAVGSVAQSYGLSGTPFWVAIDDNGEVVARVAGLLDRAQLDALVEMTQGSTS